MNYGKLALYINTIKYLRFIQLYYRLYYFVRNKFVKKRYSKSLKEKVEPLVWKNYVTNKNSYLEKNSFSFLNIPHKFNDSINWNYSEYGKLWTYNLNYFDFLNQKQIIKEDGLELINDFITNDTFLKDGREPYPISLRGINWVKFLSSNEISNVEINQYLYNDYQNLLHNLEYHLLGNHLLENAFSLFFGAYYFKDEEIYKRGKRLLKNELNEQILQDGGHYELSPMYHQIIFHRLLDCIQLAQTNQWKDDDLLPFLKEKAALMLTWLQHITYKNGSIPMLNDSAYDIATSSKDLFVYAGQLGINAKNVVLSDSGYRVKKNEEYEFIIDFGEIGPKYQVGHAHADTFNFELNSKNNPIIVDRGISTYEKNKLRQKERGTESHNTVMVGDQDQSQVWGGFRVANRAKITNLVEKENYFEATHNGYKKLGILHTRKIYFEKNKIEIKDVISKDTNLEQVSFFHFHPTIKNIVATNTKVKLIDETITLSFMNSKKIELVRYKYAIGFNKTVSAYKLKVYFSKSLETIIRL